MALYVVPVDPPAQGVDWQTVVPGQYLWNVTGITGTLDTGGPFPTIALDASGNGRNGEYQHFAPQIIAPGLLPAGGDAALLCANNLSYMFARNYIEAPGQTFDWSAPWTVEFWCQGTVFPLFGMTATDPLATGAVVILTVGDGLGNDVLKCTTSNFASEWVSDVVTLGDDLPHHIVVTYDGAAIAFYLDGVSVAVATTGNPMDVFSPVATQLGANGAGTPFAHGFVDEIAIYAAELGAGAVADHFAAGSVSFADYTAAVLADSPYLYYHTDDTSGGGRQVDLVIRDGSRTVEEIPTGFAVPTGDSPYEYSWQPTLRSSTQIPSGNAIAVAIPRLILPAGYTIGTRTLDLAPSDQWADVSIWWDSNAQDALRPIDPYAYPPGALLTYQGPRPRP